MINYLKETNNKIAKIKTEISKNIANNLKKLNASIDKNKKDNKRINENIKKANKLLKGSKTALLKRKQNVRINAMKKEIAELSKALILLKAKEQHLKELAKLANKSLKGKPVQAKKKTVNKKLKKTATKKLKARKAA